LTTTILFIIKIQIVFILKAHYQLNLIKIGVGKLKLKNISTKGIFLSPKVYCLKPSFFPATLPTILPPSLFRTVRSRKGWMERRVSRSTGRQGGWTEGSVGPKVSCLPALPALPTVLRGKEGKDGGVRTTILPSNHPACPSLLRVRRIVGRKDEGQAGRMAGRQEGRQEGKGYNM
jgi:hypothetical protein